MRIRLVAAEGERVYDTELARFTDREVIPCFRCGECCRRWQPLVGQTEASRLAAALAMGLDDFLEQFTTRYPLDDELFLINQAEGSCVFLRFEQDGRSLCAVHEARPQACRDWDASLLRRECLDGLVAQRPLVGLVVPLPLYDDPAEFAAFCDRLRDSSLRPG